MRVRELQPLKAPHSMVVTELGMFTLVKLLHSSKAYQLIVVTVLGMTTLVRPVHL